MNAEIVERLRHSFQSDEEKTDLIARAVIGTYPDIADRIEEKGRDQWDDYLAAAEEARREEIEQRAEELLAEREKEKDSK